MKQETKEKSPRSPREKPALKAFRTASILFASLLVVLVGVGVLYVWLGSSEAPTATIAEPKEKPQLQEKEVPILDPKAPVGVSVQTVNSPVEPGQNVVLIAKTKPEAICQIKVEYNKVASKDSGLHEKTADVFGMIQWSWAVEETTPLGTWPITITCAKDEKSGVVVADLEVKYAE